MNGTYIMRTATRSPFRTPSWCKPATRLCTCSFISPYDQRMQSLESEVAFPCCAAGSCFDINAGRSACFAAACSQNWPSESSHSGLSVGPDTRESNAPLASFLVGCSWYAEFKLEASRSCLRAGFRTLPDLTDRTEASGNVRGGMLGLLDVVADI